MYLQWEKVVERDREIERFDVGKKCEESGKNL